MKRSVTALASLALAVALSGCGLFGDKADAKKDWTAAEFYNAAKTASEFHPVTIIDSSAHVTPVTHYNFFVVRKDNLAKDRDTADQID